MEKERSLIMDKVIERINGLISEALPNFITRTPETLSLSLDEDEDMVMVVGTTATSTTIDMPIKLERQAWLSQAGKIRRGKRGQYLSQLRRGQKQCPGHICSCSCC